MILLILGTLWSQKDYHVEKALERQKDIRHNNVWSALLSEVNDEARNYPAKIETKGVEDHRSPNALGFLTMGL